MKENVIISLADSNYYDLLDELVDSVKRFKECENTAICILDAGLKDDQKQKLSTKVDDIKSADWDIDVPDFKVRGREWLKSQVSRAFLPKYFPGYNKYLWIDADAWVNSWTAIELYLKGCENNKLSIATSLLLISKFPSYSFKKIVIQRKATIFLLFGIVLFFGLLLIYPFNVISISAIIYLGMLPISFFHYQKLKKQKEDQSYKDEDDDLEDIL